MYDLLINTLECDGPDDVPGASKEVKDSILATLEGRCANREALRGIWKKWMLDRPVRIDDTRRVKNSDRECKNKNLVEFRKKLFGREGLDLA